MKSEYLQSITSNKKLATFLSSEEKRYYQNLYEDSLFQLPKDISFPDIKQEFLLDNINASQESSNNYGDFTLQRANIITNELEQCWANNTYVPISQDTFIAWLYDEHENMFAIGKIIDYSDDEAIVELYTQVDNIFSPDSNTLENVKVARKSIIVGNFDLTQRNTIRQRITNIIKNYFQLEFSKDI